jgi:hypothetical protein
MYANDDDDDNLNIYNSFTTITPGAKANLKL